MRTWDDNLLGWRMVTLLADCSAEKDYRRMVDTSIASRYIFDKGRRAAHFMTLSPGTRHRYYDVSRSWLARFHRSR